MGLLLQRSITYPSFPAPEPSLLSADIQGESIMPALSEPRSDVTNQRSGWLGPIYPVACLVFGGLLTVAWTFGLAFCAYHAICWLLG
jgi:hypothetical protein